MNSLRIREVTSPTGTRYQRIGRSFHGFGAALTKARSIVEKNTEITAVAFPDVDRFDDKTVPNDTGAYVKQSVRSGDLFDETWHLDADRVPKLFAGDQVFHIATRDIKADDDLRVSGKILFIFPVRKESCLEAPEAGEKASARSPLMQLLHYSFRPGALDGGLQAVGV